jgi:mannose-6-phosphate isomerase
MPLREPLLFQPLYQERVWGGRVLEVAFGRTLPAARPIGESWEIVDRPEAQSVIRGGQLKGWTLRRIIAEHAAEVMGPKWPAERPFPLLVKWLDCRERLSLQVHPPAEAASELKGEVKTENWYIAHSDQGAELFVGIKPGISRARFEEALAAGAAESCVNRIHVAAGDSILVPSGQVHAIGAGNLILEIQQNSDTTYRVHDWGRVGLDGRPRKLHVAESLRSIAWGEEGPAPVRAAPTSGVIADCPEFRIRRVVLGPGERLRLEGGEEPRILSVVSGGISWEGDGPPERKGGARSLAGGENALLACSASYTFSSEATAILLLTENFA